MQNHVNSWAALTELLSRLSYDVKLKPLLSPALSPKRFFIELAVVLPIEVEKDLLVDIAFEWALYFLGVYATSPRMLFFKLNSKLLCLGAIFFSLSSVPRLNRFFLEGESLHLP